MSDQNPNLILRISMQNWQLFIAGNSMQMKNLITKLFHISASFWIISSAFSQTNQWTWINGTNGTNQYGVYGTQGLASSSNYPGARTDACEWVDNAGDLWLFGGYGYASSGSQGYLNDLWYYHVATNEWTWMKGSNSANSNGSFGTLGNANSSNNPPSRSGAICWLDFNSGNLWLFGGSAGSGFRNDLWRYNFSSNLWIWECGSNSTNQFGNYGTQGTMASSNIPGARASAVSFDDGSGKFWMYGGYGKSSSEQGYLNDVWNYDTAANQWTWMKGSSGIDQMGSYGSQGNSSASNTPGGRDRHVSWVDTVGSFWMFGGVGYGTSSNYETLGDLWQFNTSTNNWTWIKGAPNQSSSYGNAGLTTTTNNPGRRWGASGEVGIDGKLWLFGGQYGYLNDLWYFDPSSSNWTWVKGANSANANPIYGTQGITSISNTPGGMHGMSLWMDANGDMYMLGGYGTLNSNLYYHDALFRIKPYSCNTSTTMLSQTNVTCFGQSTGSLTCAISGGSENYSYLWSNGSSTTNSSIVTSTISNLTAGTYTVTTTDANGCSATASTTITDPASAVSVSISSVSNVLCFGENNGEAMATCSGGTGTITYAWSSGATTATAGTLTAGTYTVTATDANGCSTSTSVSITEPDLLTVSLAGTDPVCDYDNNGALISTTAGGTTPYSYTWSNSANTADLADLFEGTYAVTGTDSNGCVAEAEETITAQSHLAIMIDSTADVVCFGDSSGWVSVLASMGAEPYTYAWSNGGTTASQNANAGAHTVTVIDNLGCQADTNTTIIEPDLLTTALTITDEVCDGDSNGTITTTPAGGTSPYTYTWSNGQTTPTATDLAPGVYDLTITDDHGCILVLTDTILPGNPLPQPDLGADTLFTTSVVYTLDPGVFDSYEWSDGSTNSTLDVSASGNYWVNVYDSVGCTGADSINVTIWPTGIAEQSAGTISVFPNPTLGQLTIKSSIDFDRNAQFELMSAQGQLVMVINAADQTDTVKLNLESLAKGTYTLRVSSSAMVKTFSVVVM